MRVIGVTGGVGCGKSEVLAFVEKHLDAVVVRADEVGRDLMRVGTDCYREIVELFGADCQKENGELDRAWISKRVFSDKKQLESLNAIVHPAVRREIERLIWQNEACGWQYFFLESAILIEAGYREICDEIWYIYADKKERIRRLSISRGYSEEKSLSIMANQMSDEDYQSKCDFVLDNGGDFEETKRRIIEHLEESAS